MSQAFKFSFRDDEDVEVDDASEGDAPGSDSESTVEGVPSLGIAPDVHDVDGIVRLSHGHVVFNCVLFLQS